MREHPPFDEIDLTEAVGRLLDAPPAGIPGDVIARLGAALGERRLPPRLFFEAVEQAPIAVSITDPQANILYVNPSFEAVTGYGADELIGNNQSLLSARQTPAERYVELWRTIGAGETWRGALVNRRKDGSRYLADITITPVVDASGAPRHFLGLHRDITELHRLEQRVRNQKQLIEGVVDAAPAVVVLLDTQRRILLDNQAYKRLLGDMRGAEPAELFLAAAGLDIEEFAAAAAAKLGFEPIEVRFDPGRGREPRWFLVSGSWIDEHDDTAENYFERQQRHCLLLVGREISGLKREQEKARMLAVRARMAEAELAQGIRETLAGAIFQLQQPLNVAASARATLARRNLADDPVAAIFGEFLDTAEHALERLRAALPAERPEPFGPVNLNQLLVDVLQLSTERLLAAGIIVDWQPAPVIPSLPGQPQRLRLALRQLLDNAIAALSVRGWQTRELRLRSAVRNGSIELVVEDSGPGIDEALQRKVFEPFFSAWPEGGSRRGMGLALVQEVVVEHGGGVAIDAAPGGGCRVTLFLPHATLGERT